MGGVPGNGVRLNLVELVICPGAVRDAILNWEDVASYLLHRLREVARRHGPSSAAAKILVHAQRQDGVAALTRSSAGAKHAVLLPLEFQIEGRVTRWFTTVTSFGGPQDALVEEVTIEQFHPVPD
jgi:hypothetical protein